MTIKVLHVCESWLLPTQNWIFTQANSLGEGFEQHVLCNRTTDSYPRLGKIHNRLQRPFILRGMDALLRRLNMMKADRFMTKTVRQNEIQLLHSHFGTTGIVGASVATAQNIPHVVTFYGFDVHHAPQRSANIRSGYEKLFRSVTRILCEGPFMAQSIVDLGCDAEKVQVQHLGIELSKFEFRERTWSSPNPLRVLLAGRFCQKKGFPIGLEALGTLQKVVDFPLEITIVGDTTSHSDKLELEKMKTAIGQSNFSIEPNFRGFLSHKELIEETYRNHVMLAPSRHADNGDCEGGAPVGLIEAAATGMQIVATNHCDIPNVVIDGKTGLIAQQNNVDDLVAKLLILVETPNEWHARALAGRNRVEEEFCAQEQGKRLAAIYQEAISP